MTDRQQRFISLLEEIFEINKSDLDFGIYRILNFKRIEITRFFKERLPQLIEDELKPFASTAQEDIRKRLLEIESQFGGKAYIAQFSPTLPIVAEYQKLHKELSGNFDMASLEADVYSALYSFFSRYYEAGDFISKRRYKEGVYALPYEGEEVKLYWANQDQYYIKTSENFRDYTFIAEDVSVHFILSDATTEQNNNKEESSKRVFMLLDDDDKPFEFNSDTKELFIRFVYDFPKDKRKKYSEDNASRIISYISSELPDLTRKLFKNVSSNPKENEPLILKHLNAYVAKNTFDYFIHKDLAAFLLRELDFYIKNEIFHIDDIETENEQRNQIFFAKIRTIKKVARILIDFLAQIENFQKKLWLKKKFVFETNYCISLDLIDESFYPEIAANEAQTEDWIKNFAIDEIPSNLVTPAFSRPLTVDFLKAHTNLVVDTGYFSRSFTDRLISCYHDIDSRINGVLIDSDNFHALNLISAKYLNRIDAVISDPPYNTGDDGFLYKDNYKHSSWLAMMSSRLQLIYPLLKDGGWMSLNINDIELYNLFKLLEEYNWSTLNSISVKMSHLSGMKMSHLDRKFSKIKESIIIASKGDNARMTPLYEPCSWKEAFNRYTSWVDFVNQKDPTTWVTMSVRQSAIKHGVDPNNQTSYERFCIDNAAHIYQRAKNDAVADMPRDNIFYEVTTATGMKKIVLNAKEVLFASSYLKNINGVLTPALPKGDIWTDIGINNVHNEGGVQLPNGKKPVKLFERLISVFNHSKDSLVLDMFAGTATIAHAIILTNKTLKCNNKYIAIQEGHKYFDTKTKQRVKNVMYSSTWKFDKPVSRKGTSQFVKYIRLESYEDALNNIVFSSKNDSMIFGDEYEVKYMLTEESRDSMLNLKRFENPFNCAMFITENNERRQRTIDLPETFNYLIGLSVNSVSDVKSFSVLASPNPKYEGAVELVQSTEGIYKFKQIIGILPDGRHTLIIWRNISDNVNESNAALDAYFEKFHSNHAENEFDVIYVNYDNNLENLRPNNKTWKVKLIETEFNKKMWED